MDIAHLRCQAFSSLMDDEWDAVVWQVAHSRSVWRAHRVSGPEGADGWRLAAGSAVSQAGGKQLRVVRYRRLAVDSVPARMPCRQGDKSVLLQECCFALLD